MKHLWLLAAAPLIMGAAPVMDATTRQDVRCLTASFFMAGSEDKEQKTAVIISAMYFLGRIDGRSATLDLEEAVAVESQGMTEAQLRAVLKECAATMEARGKAIVTLGENLQKRGL